MEFEILIGTEVHLQLRTATKLFCGCQNEFHAEPNTLTCPICRAEPGVLPVINQQAYTLALLAGQALNCEIQSDTRFDRKNYFYPDLPKGYQITQFFYPFAKDGHLEIDVEGKTKKIRIERIHLEEDSGKLTHPDDINESWVDLNRAGVPLIEIVSRPDLSGIEETHVYLTKLRLLLRHLEVSDCEMQEGSLRVDLNVNIHIQDQGQTVATPIVEVKNLNSFSQIQNCIAYETSRQMDEWKTNNKTIDNTPKETRGWDDKNQVTVVQRQKEKLSDYRYFPEPDLPPFQVTREMLEALPAIEAPWEAQKRLVKAFGVQPEKVNKLIQSGKQMVDAFEKLVARGHDPQITINWLINETFEVLNEKHCQLADIGLELAQIGHIVDALKEKKFALRVARKIFRTMVNENLTFDQVVQRDQMIQIDDDSALQDHCRAVIDLFPKAVDDYRGGKKAALNGLMGRVMQRTQGKANPQKVMTLLESLLNS